MEYQIARGFSVQVLEEIVRINIKKGWTIVGGAFAIESGLGVEYYQTMTKGKKWFPNLFAGYLDVELITKPIYCQTVPIAEIILERLRPNIVLVAGEI